MDINIICPLNVEIYSVPEILVSIVSKLEENNF